MSYSPEAFIRGNSSLLIFKMFLEAFRSLSSIYPHSLHSKTLSFKVSSNQRNNFLHTVSNKLINENQVISLETLLVNFCNF